MKRTIIFCTAAVVMGLLLLLIFLPGAPLSRFPYFVPAPNGITIPAYQSMTYNFLLPSPFEGGLAWLICLNRTNSSAYLYDLEKMKVRGELKEGWPVFGNRDGSKVLLNGYAVSFRQKCVLFLERISGGKIKLAAGRREESFIVLDTIKNKAVTVGNIFQMQGAGSRWYPSPSFRYGFTQPTSGSRDEVFVCDLEKQRMQEITMQGAPVGWWDETTILFKSKEDDLALYDITSDKISILLKADEIKAFLTQNNFETDLSSQDVKPFPMWDGKQYQFYFTDTLNRWKATNSFLGKLERPSGKLKLIDPNFKFEWSDIFDPTGRYYIFSGRDVGDDKVSAVFLRDLQTGTTRTLVEDCGSKRFSIPQWHNGDVIFSRSNKLWRIALNETNARQVFPPVDR